MASIRERILASLAADLAGVAGIDGRVYRSDPNPSARDLHPFVTLDWQSDQAAPATVPQTERRLVALVSVFVRGDGPDTLADPIMVAAHAAITADTTRGGLAIDTLLADASFEVESADETAGRLTHVYEINYRHSFADMTA